MDQYPPREPTDDSPRYRDDTPRYRDKKDPVILKPMEVPVIDGKLDKAGRPSRATGRGASGWMRLDGDASGHERRRRRDDRARPQDLAQ